MSTSGGDLLEVRDVQVFGGYVLHIGLLSPGAGALRIDEEITCSVDYGHRRLVAPNHTMTHVLNWALREVLGDGVDQRGSVVNSERLRFDFSAERVKTDQLQRVEELVQERIDASLPVTTETVSLENARSINGLRAMAGESYPDPVRVVTVGASPLEEILQDPAAESWREQSVEFCGGTHISNSTDAGAFAILEESAVSKGVRRIVAATGSSAKAARDEGQLVLKSLEKLEASPVEADVVKLGQDLDSKVMPAALKAICRERLVPLRKKLKKKKSKGVGKAVLKEAKNQILETATSAQDQNRKFSVVLLKELDGKALGQVTQGMEANVMTAVLALAEEGDQVFCVAIVPESLQGSSHDAPGWVKAVLEPLGGRGGGQAGRAQGKASAAAGSCLAGIEAASALYWDTVS